MSACSYLKVLPPYVKYLHCNRDAVVFCDNPTMPPHVHGSPAGTRLDSSPTTGTSIFQSQPAVSQKTIINNLIYSAEIPRSLTT